MATEQQSEEIPNTMHTYSTDNDLRLRIAAGLGIVSYLIVEWFPYLGRLVSQLIPFSIDPTAPTLGLTLTVLTAVFAKWLWTQWPIRALGLVDVPNLDGEWTGEITSSFGDAEEERGSSTQVEVTIEQSWRKITIEFETDDSRSYSLGASFITAQSDTQLHYHYQSIPKPHAPDTMSIHRGSTELRFIEGENGNPDQLVGRYYTGRGRQNHGRIKVERVNY